MNKLIQISIAAMMVFMVSATTAQDVSISVKDSPQELIGGGEHTITIKTDLNEEDYYISVSGGSVTKIGAHTYTLKVGEKINKLGIRIHKKGDRSAKLVEEFYAVNPKL